MRIYNPDGSEAEKSGSGLRIFAKFLYEHKLTKSKMFTIETLGGVVTCEVGAVTRGVTEIRIDMGRASFGAQQIPVAGEEREVVAEPICMSSEAFGQIEHGNKRALNPPG